MGIHWFCDLHKCWLQYRAGIRYCRDSKRAGQDCEQHWVQV